MHGGAASVQQDSPTFPILKNDERLIAILEKSSLVEFSLVNAIGNSITSVYSGYLGRGMNAVFFDWSAQNFSGLYLVLKINGTLATMKLISEIPEEQ